MTCKPLEESANVIEEACGQCGATKSAVKREDGSTICTRCIYDNLVAMQERFKEQQLNEGRERRARK